MKVFAAIGVLLTGAALAFIAYLRLGVADARAVAGVSAAFLVGAFCAIVAIGTSGKKRTLSLPGQTLLGVLVACIIATLFHATPTGYLVAVLLGLALGSTAHLWAERL